MRQIKKSLVQSFFHSSRNFAASERSLFNI